MPASFRRPRISWSPACWATVADAHNVPAPLTASTFTDRDGVRTAYVFAFNQAHAPQGFARFSPTELGLTGPAYVYDYFSGSGTYTPPGASFSAPLGENRSAFYVVAPVGPSGIAFLGDKDKFVGTGRQRIGSLEDSPGRMAVGVVLADNETSVVLHGFATGKPRVSITFGAAAPLHFDLASGYFTVEVRVAPGTPEDKSARDPVRHLTVTLATSSK